MRYLAYGQSHESFLDRLLEQLRLKRVIGSIPKGAIVVDLGCGFTGDLLTRLAPSIKEGIGFDLSVHNQQPASNVFLHKSRVDAHLPLKNNSVQVVTALAIIEHVEHPDTLFTEAYRILKPAGQLLITTPPKRAQPLLEWLAFRLRLISPAEIADHKRYYNRYSLEQALVHAGFKPRAVSIASFELGFNLFARAIK